MRRLNFKRFYGPLSAVLIVFSVAAYAVVKTDVLKAGNIQLSGNTVSTTNTNGNLTIDLNGTGKTIFADLTASRVPYLDSSKQLTSSIITNTELEQLSGVGSLVCGKSDTCTLANHTLTSPIISGANFNFGFASNTNRLVLPTDTTTNLDTYTDTAGLLAYDSTQQKPVYNNGSGWIAVGSGAGGSGFFNLLVNKNWDFESSLGATTDWTASGGTFSAATTTNILDGAQSVTWDSSSASQTLSSSSVTIPYGMYGRNGWAQCKFLTPSGTATHKIQVYDGTNVIAEQAITSSTSPTFSGTTFIWPSTGSLSLRVISVASNEPLIAIDSCSLGDANEQKISQISQARKIGSWDSAGTANCSWGTVTATSYTSFSADTDCPTPTVTGQITAAATKIPAFNIINGSPGTYLFVAQGPFFVSGANQDLHGFRFYDGSTASAGAPIGYGTGTSAHTITGSIDYTSGFSSKQIEIQCLAQSTDSCSIRNNLTQNATHVDVYFFPNSSQQAYNFDTSGMAWSGYHDSNCSWARTSNAYGDSTADSTCTFTERTNRNFGTVTSYLSGSDKLPGIVFTPKRAGRYFVCAQAKGFNNTSGGNEQIRLWDGTTVISESRFEGTANYTNTHINCGIYEATNTSAKTLSLQMLASGSSTSNISSSGSSVVEWSIFALDQSFPSPVLANPITFRANSTAGQTITNTNTSTIVFGTETDDTANAYNPSTGEFTVPVNGDGRYQFNSCINNTTTGSSTRLITIYKNGSEISRGNRFSQASAILGNCVSDILKLVAGDVITIRFENNSGATVTLQTGTGEVYFSGARISP